MSNDKMITLIEVLVQKTDAGSIDWEEDPWNRGFSIQFNDSRVLLDTDSVPTLTIYNHNGDPVETINDDELLTLGYINEIKNLYEKARRKALNADEIINTIIDRLR
jgi:hypothetical protein